MTNKDVVTKDHFSDLRTQLAKIKAENKSIVFDYEAQEKEARSHVNTLRLSKKPITELHKEKKAFFLEEGRKIDAGKNELIAEIEEMIDVHAKPLQALKDKKDAEIELERLKVIFDIDHAEAIEMDNYFNEKRAFEKEKAELQRVLAEQEAKEQAEQAEKDRLEYEARIKKEAEEKAKREAEEALLFAEQENARLIIAAENAERLRLEEAEAEKVRHQKAIEDEKRRSEEEKAEVLASHRRLYEAKEQAEKERLETERLIAEKKVAEQKRIDDARKADIDHRAKINNMILSAIIPYCIDEKKAKELIGLVLTGCVPNTTINY